MIGYGETVALASVAVLTFIVINYLEDYFNKRREDRQNKNK